jgi:hypothetical protein
MSFLTPQLFDLLIIVVIILGLALAGVRFYSDLTRPLPQRRSRADSETTASDDPA